ncbi:MAG: TetR/AcrR family transcriptional regulator [Anaerolineales bacterium]|nr:MAG: TetR/AcrR family transcriptional regulator [Anaerolineales bacterium]
MMKQQDRATQTKESILKAAEHLFAVQGYEATSVSMICDAAGVSKGAFYHHFETKQSIFLELMQRWLKGLDEQLVLIDESTEDVKEGLLSMGEIIGQVLDVGGPQLPIFLEFWSRAIRDPDVWEATVEPFQRYRDFFAALVQRGIDEGSLRDLAPHNTARVLIALAVGMLVQGLLDTGGEDWQDITKEALEFLLHGIAAR